MKIYLRASVCALELLIALVLCGCGGGSSAPAGGGMGGSSLTEQTRTAALDAIGARYDSLPQKSATDDAASLLAFIRTRSEFAASGIARDNSVWARFTDGRPLVITLNDFPDLPASKLASRSVMPARSTGAAIDIPVSNKVYLVNTREMGDAAVTKTFDRLENIYLPPNSYQPIVIDGTIEHLKVIQNAGVLYNIGHAGLGFKGLPRDDPGTPEYVFGTLTRRDVGTDATYNAELTAGEVGYLLEPTIIDRLTGMYLSRYKLGSGYFITDKFVTKYWTFSANSLFISDNCDGGSAEAQPFIQACFGKGLSTYIGWDNAVANSNANESALFLFDRMLGYNDLSSGLQPESPPQRPFDYGSILVQMSTKSRTSQQSIPGLTLTTSFSVDSVGYGFLKGGKANLKDFENPVNAQANFGLLNPTISAARVDEQKHQMILTGIFGSDPGTASHAVLVGGMDLTAQTTWTPTMLTISSLPTSGPGSSGTISVNVRGHLSNPIQLTAWRGVITATLHRQPGENETLTYNMHLRGILNFLRGSPGQTPLHITGAGITSVYDDSTASWDANGANSSSGVTESLARVGPAAIPLSNSSFVIGVPGRIASFGFSPDFSASPPLLLASAVAYVNDAAGSLQVTHTDEITGSANSFNLPMYVSITTDKVASMDANFNILPHTWTSADGSQTVSWGSMSAVSPPDQTISRSVSQSARRK